MRGRTVRVQSVQAGEAAVQGPGSRSLPGSMSGREGMEMRWADHNGLHESKQGLRITLSVRRGYWEP